MTTSCRWDWLYEVQPQPVADFLLDKLAEDLERDIREFPPEVEDWQNPTEQQAFEALVAEGLKPSESAVRTAIWLAQCDLRREFEAVDQFMRNGGLDARLGNPQDRLLVRFLWHFLEDKVLAFGEAAHSRFKRAELAHSLNLLERRLYRVTAN